MFRSESNSTATISIVLALALFAFADPASAEDFFVSSANDIDSAVRDAGPGDTLIMTDGVWTNQQIDFEGFGTQANPITL